MTDPASWNEWLAAATVSKQQRRDLQRFVATFGYDYAFLFTEQSGQLILDNTRAFSRRFSPGSSSTIETNSISFRFFWHFRDSSVELSPRHRSDFEWIDDQAAALLLLAGELNGDGNFPPQTIQLPPAAYIFQTRFSDLEAAFSPASFKNTRDRLDAIYRSRSQQGPLRIVPVPEPTALSGTGFLSNYSRLSDDISRVPFWKPLGIYAAMILLLPFLFAAALLIKPALYIQAIFRGQRR